LLIFSASSSGISIPNSSSKAITSSTMSSESAPRSSVKLASGVTSSASTPSCSTMMLLTLSATAIALPPGYGGHPTRPGFSTRDSPESMRLEAGEGSYIEAPRHVERLAGDVAPLLAGEVEDGPGDVVDLAQALQGDRPGELVAGGFWERLGHRRL